MTREEQYKHQTIDKIISVSEYVEIMLDDAMDTDMPIEKKELICMRKNLYQNVGYF